jgi:glycosyltransferase involved in cell wall biosynthesis
MRVVQLITQARGGPVDHAADVAVELGRLGVDSHVVGPPGEYVDRIRDAGVRWHRAEIRDKLDLVGARHVARQVRSLAPDVVHGQDRRAGLVSRLLLRHGTDALVYTLHGVPDQLADLVPGNLRCGAPSTRDRIAYLTAERRLAQLRRSTVVAPCEALARYARDAVGIAPERVAVVPNGVAASMIAPAAPPAGVASHRTTTALWLGLMQPVKRLPELVGAAAGVPGLRLTLVGDGPERADVERAVEAAGSRDRVHLVGYVADPAPYLAAADLLVLPSAAEACPLAVLRAMAAGLPVVASRAGGLPELVRDGVDGLLVPTGDDAALRAALAALAADPARRRRMGESARRRVTERFTVERCTRRLLDVYQAALG